MSIYTKPIYEAEKQLAYFRHLERLDSITHERSKRVIERNTIEEMHRIRNKSLHFRKIQKEEGLHQQNLLLMNKILHISKRKSSAYVNLIDQYPKIKSFNSPARKKNNREIQLKNQTLAERILSQQSKNDRSKIFKEISEYEKIKILMEHNKKLPIPDFAIDIKQSRERKRILNPEVEPRIHSESVATSTS